MKKPGTAPAFLYGLGQVYMALDKEKLASPEKNEASRSVWPCRKMGTKPGVLRSEFYCPIVGGGKIFYYIY
ncbi:hypothetical protein [Luteithermobacter gelatinilyticus]|uniref:hypothetical protein n=1 Tax=Luteithermobacter gelatinilyticus TaxID=2582913 RepID=UPI001AEF4137|nr:hypothetical protein [Luteithermobacter gelatinilyticus]